MCVCARAFVCVGSVRCCGVLLALWSVLVPSVASLLSSLVSFVSVLPLLSALVLFVASVLVLVLLFVLLPSVASVSARARLSACAIELVICVHLRVRACVLVILSRVSSSVTLQSTFCRAKCRHFRFHPLYCNITVGTTFLYDSWNNIPL